MTKYAWSVGMAFAIALLMSACVSATSDHTVVLDDLNEPRGMWMLTDGTLCVAEAGSLPEGQSVREGPTANRADTGSLTCMDADGARQRVVEQLPYVLYNVTGVTTGPADVAEMGGELYLLTGEGEGDLARTLLRITDHTAPPEVVGDFLAFATETAPADLFDVTDIFSNPFAMVPDPGNGRFLVTDGATGHVLAVGLDGAIEVFAELPGHEVLTGIARGPDDAIFVASFSQLPHATGTGSVLQVFADGSFAVAVDIVTTPIDLAFDAAGRLYVLEFIGDNGSSDPYRGRTGRLLRFEPDGDGWDSGTVLIENLPFPTALLIDARDRVYISVHGAFSAAGSGLVVRIHDLAEREAGDPPLQFTE